MYFYFLTSNKNKMNITYNQSNTVLNAAINKARELNISVSIAILDTGGHLVIFARLDNPYGLNDFAIKKAKTAIMFGVNTTVMGAIVAGAQSDGIGMVYSNGGLLTLAGGLLLKNNEGNTIGSIGVSGGTVEQDRVIAEAGVAILSQA